MPPLRVMLDTCVLAQAAVRDTLLRLAEAGYYRPRWSEAILAELARTLQGPSFNLTASQVDHLLEQLHRAFPEAVVGNYGRYLHRVTNDPKDRHVLAAAIRGEARLIVTHNLADFPSVALAPWRISAIAPDPFLEAWARFDAAAVTTILAQQAADLRRSPVDLTGLLARLERPLPRFVAVIRRYQASPGE